MGKAWQNSENQIMKGHLEQFLKLSTIVTNPDFKKERKRTKLQAVAFTSAANIEQIDIARIGEWDVDYMHNPCLSEDPSQKIKNPQFRPVSRPTPATM